MAGFAAGEYVELYATIPSRGGSVRAGTCGIVRAVDRDRHGDAIYPVAFLSSERLTGEAAWPAETDLLAA